MALKIVDPDWPTCPACKNDPEGAGFDTVAKYKGNRVFTYRVEPVVGGKWVDLLQCRSCGLVVRQGPWVKEA